MGRRRGLLGRLEAIGGRLGVLEGCLRGVLDRLGALLGFWTTGDPRSSFLSPRSPRRPWEGPRGARTPPQSGFRTLGEGERRREAERRGRKIKTERKTKRNKDEGRSKERQRGLYGELTFLNTLLGRSSDFVKTIVSWTGPEGSNQDFSNELSAVEVKSSKATKPSLYIASELQLDWTKLDSLFLCVIHVDEISNGVDTLKKLIEEIKQKVSNHPNLLKLFEEKLDRVGIPEGEEKHYDDFGFIIRSKRAYKVEDGFPALTRDILNNYAIHNVKYQIDLTACESFEVVMGDVISEMI